MRSHPRPAARLVLFSVLAIAPLSRAQNWTNTGSASAAIEWGDGASLVTITTNERAGSFVFNAAYTGSTFLINAQDGSGSLTLGGAGVVNNSSATPLFRAINGAYLYFAGTGNSLGNATYRIESASTLQVRASDSIDGSSATVNLVGGTFTISNPADPGPLTIGALAGSGTVNIVGSPLTVGGRGIDTTFDGGITGDATTFDPNAIAVTKVGSGTWTLSGPNDYTGKTLISAGTVKISNSSGSAFGTGAVTVASGATLTGAGAFTGAFTNNGTYSPGNSPTLATLSSFSQGSTGNVVFELGGLTRGTQYDALDITNAAVFGGTLTVSLIDGFNPVSGNTFNLFDWGSVSGTFGTLNLPSLDSGLSWNTSSLYTTGEISVSAVPEPSTYAATAAAVALIVAFIRRRKPAISPPRN